MTRFIYGRDLLDLLMRLVTTYRDQLMDGGDSKARRVFGKSEYAVPSIYSSARTNLD